MKLEEYLPKFRKPLIAFSGGSDSTYLFMKVRDLCKDYVCVSLIMPNSPQRDMDRINEFSGKIIKTEYNPLLIPEFAENTEERCYFCKKNMFSILKKIKEEEGCDCIFDGTNGSDTGSYRPGRRAAEEAGVLSPLLICGITKDMIRKETENLFSPVSDSCYATRIPYCDRITPEKMDKIKKAENYILGLGVSSVRCGLHGNLMRLDVPQNELDIIYNSRVKITDFIHKLGINYVTLDLEGFVSGKQDRKIT